MTNKEAIKYLQQLYPNGGHCWLDEQRMEAIGMAINALEEESVSEELEEAIGQSFVYHEKHGDDFRSDKQIETAYRYGFETGANWQKQKDSIVSEALEDAASSFARKDSEGISNPANFYYTVADKARIFKAGAKWQKEHLWKPVC